MGRSVVAPLRPRSRQESMMIRHVVRWTACAIALLVFSSASRAGIGGGDVSAHGGCDWAKDRANRDHDAFRDRARERIDHECRESRLAVIGNVLDVAHKTIEVKGSPKNDDD